MINEKRGGWIYVINNHLWLLKIKIIMKIIHDKCIFCIFFFLVYAGKKNQPEIFKINSTFTLKKTYTLKIFKENFIRKLLKNIEKSRNMHVYFFVFMFYCQCKYYNIFSLMQMILFSMQWVCCSPVFQHNHNLVAHFVFLDISMQ